MAISWTGSTGLMTRIGKLIKALNARAATPAAMTTEQAYVQAVFDTAGREDQVGTLSGDYDGLRDGQAAARQRVARYADAVAADRVEVLTPLGLTQSGMGAAFWQAFVTQMTADAQAVLKSTVTLGTVTAAGTNTGTGTVLATLRLDGYNAPARRAPALLAYAGATSQLCAAAETMLFLVTSDAGSGATAGQESVAWSGGIQYGVFDWRGEGSGAGPTLTNAGAGGVLTDGGFEQFATNTPTYWTIDAGTAGTHVFQDTTAGNFFRDLSALKLTGDGALATIQVSQAVASRVNPLRMYALSLRLKASATVAAGDFEAILTGTGYTAGGGESVAVGHASLPTTWTLYSAFILMPAAIPADLKLVVRWKNTPTTAKNVWVDCVALVPATYFGGVGAVAVPGAADCVRGDRWTMTVANDDAGLFQAFARKWWAVQLVSATGGSETIGNSLAS